MLFRSLLTGLTFLTAVHAQGIDNYECTFTVTSIDHVTGTEGKYFNFDLATVSSILSSTGGIFTTGSNYDVYNARTNQVVNVIIWSSSNGGSIGDGHGRLSSGAAEGDWQTGDVLAFDGITEYCNPDAEACPFQVLGVDHDFGAAGQYFNFDVDTVSSILALGGSAANPFATSTYYDVLNSRTGQVVNVVLWNVPNGGTGGDGHGRLTTGASGGDWQVGDILTFDGIETYCDDATTAFPTSSPVKSPTVSPIRSPTKSPSRSPSVDGCDFDLEWYLETCYCSSDESALAAHLSMPRSVPVSNVPPVSHVPSATVGAYTVDQVMYAVHIWGFILASLLTMNLCVSCTNKKQEYKVIDMSSEIDY